MNDDMDEAVIGQTYDVQVSDCCMLVQFRATLEAILGPEVEYDPLADEEAGGWPEYRTYWSNGVVLDSHGGAQFKLVTP